MSANLTMTDLFCGAGGSSTGAIGVPGVTVRLAANHWDLAIETHNANHPDTDHLQADISQTDPRYVPATDLLWASPECTNHSRAKGRKLHRQPDIFGEVLPDEAAERSRATMWDVVRFTEAHEYRAILVENVVEVVDWSSAHGIRGGLFDSWLAAMHSMDYQHRIISLNSMHAQVMGLPAPQSRDRVYIAFWRKGERAPDFERMQRPRAYCPSCDEVVDAMQAWKRPGTRTGRYRTQYVYRCPKVSCRGQQVEPGWLPASSIIDWSLPGTRIGDRGRPLAEKTMRRIQMGIDRYWAPLTVEAAGNTYDATNPRHPAYGREDGYIRAWPASDPLRAVHTTVSKGIAYDPLMVPAGGTWNDDARPTNEVARTRTTRETEGLAFPPFFAELRGGGSVARPASEALATVTASGNHHALIHRNNGGGAEMTTPATEPVRTVTTAGHQSVLTAQRPTVNVDDVYFRMLEPHEIKQAMAFPADYVMRGNRREQVKLSGNAVTPPAARDLIATVVSAITGQAA
ncbi:DNA (cytosine-5)-methyltransferase 1 [Georgenia satyanarayanai]|uniref:DNA (cytosine-5-)-methyltransferase n=1 Tax=Georgenia satyanarayanai TaxID=860221 RepID=A0A2Y9ACW7_9MICO|nr:DNA cytosine methyltransferase [Georgenia satyanarayanai]PYG00184.1 DNA (cytosine-5)-methyltransferase 1 [Georgenia satyanarayanai]SSA40419.1 DNA (cytosine-5)-methyltransferase 1 [Georgenia satyanarayanai]